MAQGGETLDMRAILNHMTVATIAGLMAMGTFSWAAVAPLGPEELRKEAGHIITGRVLEVNTGWRGGGKMDNNLFITPIFYGRG